jgi:PAS domain S-box-containing protein
MTTFSTPMQKMFEGNELTRGKTDIRALPEDAIVINRPITLFGQYKGVVITAGIVFFALSVLVLVLWTQNRRLERLMVTTKDSEARFRVMIEHAPVAIIVYDPDLRKIIDANLKATKLFGCTMQALLQEDPERFYQPDKEGSIVESMKDHHSRAMSGDEVVFERMIGTCDERKLQCEIRLAKLPFLGQRLLRASFIDITERKRAEEERTKLEVQLQRAHKLEAIGQLAGGVAHDFNNMLGVILGYTELAMEQIDPTQPVIKDLEEIRSAAKRSADITRQLLAFARKQTVAPKVIDLNETLESLLKMLRRLIGEDVDLSWLPGSRLWSIKMDPSQVDQILANLCVNARGAISGVGKIVVETGNSIFDEEYCSSHVDYVPGEYVRLMVSDNGCGMSKETMSHIFEPFFTTKAAGGGTGLGLATVYGVVKQNKGFINVYSEPGQGTTFTIYLPRYLGETDQGPTKDAVEPETGGDETILLVEDEPTILAMTKTMLQRLGYNVLTAASPLDAIRIAESSDGIDLLITDVIMPEMNGRDLAEKILTGKSGLKHLFMSGYTADIISKQGVIDEKVCFIQKPFTKTELAGKVRQALG